MIIGKRYRRADAQANKYSEAKDIVLTAEEARWVNEVFKNLTRVGAEFELRGAVFIDDLDTQPPFREHVLMELGNNLLKKLMEMGNPTDSIKHRIFKKHPLTLAARRTQHGEALQAFAVVLQQVPALPPNLARSRQAPSLADLSMEASVTDTPAIEFPEDLLESGYL